MNLNSSFQLCVSMKIFYLEKMMNYDYVCHQMVINDFVYVITLVTHVLPDKCTQWLIVILLKRSFFFITVLTLL